jgi:hypothetical protein
MSSTICKRNSKYHIAEEERTLFKRFLGYWLEVPWKGTASAVPPKAARDGALAPEVPGYDGLACVHY